MMKPLSIYIHIPFCSRKCPYCDFVSFDNKPDKVDEYVNVLCQEIQHVIARRDDEAIQGEIQTIFFGGGTPSILTNDQMSKIFSAFEFPFKISFRDVQKGCPENRGGVCDCEITIEANPNSINQNKLTHWLSLGINRLSIGVQSFDDATLKTLGRTHTAKQAIDAVKLAHAAGFRNINIDLIHSVTAAPINIPSEIFKYITHVSAYCLTPTSLEDTESIKQQKQVELILAVQGLEKYEVSNFARLGFKCRHNLAYWHPQTHEYLGFGVGAHSFFRGERFAYTKDFDQYINSPSRGEGVPPQSGGGVVECIMLALRTTDGVDATLLQNKSSEIELLKSLNLIKQENGRISATSKGFFVLDSIIEKLT